MERQSHMLSLVGSPQAPGLSPSRISARDGSSCHSLCVCHTIALWILLSSCFCSLARSLKSLILEQEAKEEEARIADQNSGGLNFVGFAFASLLHRSSNFICVSDCYSSDEQEKEEGMEARPN